MIPHAPPATTPTLVPFAKLLKNVVSILCPTAILLKPLRIRLLPLTPSTSVLYASKFSGQFSVLTFPALPFDILPPPQPPLLDTLFLLSIQNSTISCFSCCLAGHSFSVYFADSSSSPQSPPAGAPQGHSLLVPLFYLHSASHQSEF